MSHTNAGEHMTDSTVENRLRRLLLIISAFVFLGTPVELWLEDHTGETLQWIPFLLCAAGLIAAVAVLIRPQRMTILALRITMPIVAAGGLLGMGLHLLNNVAFEQEIRPSAAAGEALLAGLKGASPLLAPGILVLAAVVSLAATYYHPALGRREINLPVRPS
jgi:hypothetical protein